MFSTRENLSAKSRKCGSDIDVCLDLFHKSISVGPVYKWFKESVTKVYTFSDASYPQYFSGILSVDNVEWICTTCKKSFTSGKVPKLAIANGMKRPSKPKELELNPLEERLIALRIPFMQLRELPRGRQYSIKGNVVNVPVQFSLL